MRYVAIVVKRITCKPSRTEYSQHFLRDRKHKHSIAGCVCVRIRVKRDNDTDVSSAHTNKFPTTTWRIEYIFFTQIALELVWKTGRPKCRRFYTSLLVFPRKYIIERLKSYVHYCARNHVITKFIFTEKNVRLRILCHRIILFVPQTNMVSPQKKILCHMIFVYAGCLMEILSNLCRILFLNN